METRLQNTELVFTKRHGSYLQGMETRFEDFREVPVCCTDPTYKEWKLPSENNIRDLCFGARILPTRNGNSNRGIILNVPNMPHGSYLQGMETPIHNCVRADLMSAHGSYLQGMETEIGGNDMWWAVVHGSYLQGMET